MNARFFFLLLFVYLFINEDVLPAQESNSPSEEITLVEGERYIFSSEVSGVDVIRKRIATCSNRVVMAKRNGETQIRIRSNTREKVINLKVLPKKKVEMRGEFPIMAWYSLQDDLSHKRFLELSEAGFNLSFSYATDSIVPQMQRAIKSVIGTGVKLVIPFRGSWIDLKPIIDGFKNDENLWGWYVIDEPSFDSFDDIKRFVDRIQALDSSHPFYINLLPIYAPSSSFGNGSYEHYVNSYVETFSPSFLSFDHYPITNSGVRKDFYSNLNIISKIANQNRIPFWAFACSVKYSGSVPSPKLEHLRFEVFNALAFGAQGIEYFTYTTPRNEHGGRYVSYAPLDVNQKKTKTYDYVKEVNARLRSIEHYIKDTKVKYIGTLCGKIDGVDRYPKSNLPEEIIGISSTNTLLASWLEKESCSIFMLVNTDINKNSTVSIVFNNSLHKISNDGQIVSVSPIEVLKPGDMICYLIIKD